MDISVKRMKRRVREEEDTTNYFHHFHKKVLEELGLEPGGVTVKTVTDNRYRLGIKMYFRDKKSDKVWRAKYEYGGVLDGEAIKNKLNELKELKRQDDEEAKKRRENAKQHRKSKEENRVIALGVLEELGYDPKLTQSIDNITVGNSDTRVRFRETPKGVNVSFTIPVSLMKTITKFLDSIL